MVYLIYPQTLTNKQYVTLILENFHLNNILADMPFLADLG
jgi:hypothetical protein